MTEIDSSQEVLRRLVELVVEHDLASLEVEHAGLKIRIKGSSLPGESAIPLVAYASPSPVAMPSSAPAPPKDSRAGLIPLESPMVGTFYRASSPEDPPFIKVGDVISVGQTVGIIEAMKVFSEVPSEVSGRVVEVLVDNGKLVQMGQPLAYLEPL